MADDPTELVTVMYEPTQETREVPRGALGGFTDHGWVELAPAAVAEEPAPVKAQPAPARVAQQPATDSKGV